MRPKFLSQILSLIALIAPMMAFAADGKGSQFGVVYGMSVPDAQNTKPYRLFGVEGKAFVNPSFSLGGYYAQSDKSGQQNSQNVFYYSLTGVEAAYHMPSGAGDTFVSFRVGMTKLTATQNNTEFIFSPYHYGVATGYDFYLSSYFSIGFEGSYMHAQPGRTTDSSGTFYNSDSFNIISFLVSLQLRL